jgi:hypothetical protein
MKMHVVIIMRAWGLPHVEGGERQIVLVAQLQHEAFRLIGGSVTTEETIGNLDTTLRLL